MIAGPKGAPTKSFAKDFHEFVAAPKKELSPIPSSPERNSYSFLHTCEAFPLNYGCRQEQ
jgi:hypothetical protein